VIYTFYPNTGSVGHMVVVQGMFMPYA